MRTTSEANQGKQGRRLPPWSPWRLGSPAAAEDDRAGTLPPVNRGVITAVTATHTLAWFCIEACVLYVLYAGFIGRSDRRAAIAAAVVTGETLTFAANRFRCPLTQLARRLGATHAGVTDIWLPK